MRLMGKKLLYFLSDRKGMTLIEVMAAMVILTIVFASFTMMVDSSSHMNIRAAETREQLDSKLEAIVSGSGGLKEKSEQIQMKLDPGGTISLDVKVKTTEEGGEPLAIIE